MAVNYPSTMFVCLSNEDRERVVEASKKEEIPPSTLIRKVLRQWLQSTETATSAMEKTARV